MMRNGRKTHRFSKMQRLLTALLTLCMAAAPAAVWAAAGGTAFAAESIDFTRDMSIAIEAFPEGHDFAEDITDAGVVVDVYQVAEAAVQTGYDAYDFILTQDFADVDLADMQTLDAQVAQTQVAAGIVRDAEEAPAPVTSLAYGESSAFAPGLYLLIPHGEAMGNYWRTTEDGSLVTVAGTQEWEYRFSPQLISLPTRESSEEVVMTSDSGEWIYDLSVSLKAERAPRFGDLIIEKTVDRFRGEPVTVVFSIVDTETGGDIYSNVASVYITDASGGSTRVTKIPAGISVTVTEIYAGPRYNPDPKPQTVQIVASTAAAAEDSIATVSFHNTSTPSGNGGHGIENHFTYNGETGGWDLVTTPVQSLEQ